MAEMIEESQGLESTTIGLNRTAATVKGGRRFSFSALVVVGDRSGSIGLGYGKAPGVPAAIEKAQKAAKKNIKRVTLKAGTIPHQIEARFGASRVRLVPGSPGTGVIAGGTVRAVLELAGVRDCLSKSYGSNNKINLARATVEGLTQLHSAGELSKLRGVELGKTEVDEKLEQGMKFAPTGAAAAEKKAKGPVNTVGQENKKGGKGGNRGRGGGGGRGRRGGDTQASEPTVASSAAENAADQSSES